MKRALWICVFLVNFVCCKGFAETPPCSLVYVHIGPQLPTYLSVAIAQARHFNANIPIYLLGNSAALANYDYRQHKIHLVPLESLNPTENHKRFKNHTSMNHDFWRYALERFLYLDDFIHQHGLNNVFHTENDVMLYFDLTEKLPIFQENYNGMIATVFDCDERSVPSFVYISNAIPSEKFAEFISVKGLNGSTDMTLLYEFKERYYKTFSDHLPILIPEYAKQRELKSLAKRIAKSPNPFINNIDKFQIIFDAAAIGQFFGGIDPILGNKGPGFVGELSVFLTHLCTYEWRQDIHGRWIPYISFGGTTYPIANLHIHCKNLQAFYSLNQNFFPLPTRAYSSLPME